MRLNRFFLCAAVVLLTATLVLLARTIAQDWRTLDAALIFGMLVVELVGFWTLQYSILKPLQISAENARYILGGNLNFALPVVRRTDEIGDMQDAVAALKAVSAKHAALASERELLVEQVKHISDIDFLTSLLNRRALMQRGEQLLAQARRQKWNVAIVLFNLDNFKQVNESHGQSIGDRVLCDVAGIAKADSRDSDLLARYGDEAFLLVAFDCPLGEAANLAERIRVHISRAVFESNTSERFQITASFGVSCRDAEATDNLESIIKEADRALYMAKAQGRNRVVAADQPARTEAQAPVTQ